MTQWNRRVATALLCVPFVLAAASCGTSSGRAASTAPSSSAGANPNATETPPPGDIPDNQAYVAYSPSDRTYTIKVPEGWARTKAGAAVVFSDKYNSVRVEKTSAATAPTPASVAASEVPAIRSAARGYVPGSVTTIRRPAGRVLRITYKADSAPNPVTGKVVVQAVERYEFWRAGTEVVVTVSGAVGADNVDPWRAVTDSFGWTA